MQPYRFRRKFSAQLNSQSRQLVTQAPNATKMCPQCGAEVMACTDTLSIADFLEILSVIIIGVAVSSIVIYYAIRYVDGDNAGYDPAKELNSQLKMLITLSKEL